MNKEQYNQSVQNADNAFTKWCKNNEIPLFKIDHVITWEKWDDGIGVYFFLPDVSDVKKLKPEKTEEMKTIYLGFLKEFGYPFENFPNVTFEIDSDENVRKNYGGSYFNRLR